jgi:C1A family cysteine protease
LGAPPESFWPYDITKFAKKPPAKAYTEARKHQAVRYARVVQDATPIQNVLASGYPISFGFTVYSSFEPQVGKNGIVPMPQPQEKTLGGHAVVAVGYKTISGQLYFECRNSWGPGWADRGYFWLPSAYVTTSSLGAGLLGDPAGRVARTEGDAPTGVADRGCVGELPARFSVGDGDVA